VIDYDTNKQRKFNLLKSIRPTDGNCRWTDIFRFSGVHRRFCRVYR